MATVRERPKKKGPSSWEITWRANGRKGGTQTISVDSEPIARRCAAYAEAMHHKVSKFEVAEAILGLPHVEPEPDLGPTVAAWAETWLKMKLSLELSTKRGYQCHLRLAILPAIGAMRMGAVTAVELSLILDKLRERGLSDRTITAYFATIHAMFRAAYRNRVIERNPAAEVDWRRTSLRYENGEDGEGHVYLTEDEVDLIIACVVGDAPSTIHVDPTTATIDQRIIWLLAYSGMRWSEMTALTVGHIKIKTDDNERTPVINVHRAWKADGARRYIGPTKGRTKRALHMRMPHAMEWISPLIEGRDACELLVYQPPSEGSSSDPSRELNYDWWTGNVLEWAVVRARRCQLHPPMREGKQPDTRKTAVSTCDCPGVVHAKVTPHAFRHSNIAWLFSYGQTLEQISIWAGHKNRTVTDLVYGHLLPSSTESIARDLGRSRSVESECEINRA